MYPHVQKYIKETSGSINDLYFLVVKWYKDGSTRLFESFVDTKTSISIGKYSENFFCLKIVLDRKIVFYLLMLLSRVFLSSEYTDHPAKTYEIGHQTFKGRLEPRRHTIM